VIAAADPAITEPVGGACDREQLGAAGARFPWLHVRGDLLQSVNGYELTSPAQALLAYTSLRNETRFTVRIVRHGEPLTLTYEIR